MRRSEFAWVSGEPVSYSHWADGEPNNYNGLGEFFGLVFPGDWINGGYWNDGGGGFWANGIAEAPPPNVLAGPIVNPANGHQYYLLDASDWVQSEAVAQAMGGHLATIRNQAEQDFIYHTFANYGGTPRHLYIGIYDRNQAENSTDRAQRQLEFAWVSGEAVTYQNWAAAEPNNFLRAGEFWGHMLAPVWESEGQTITSQGEWNDVSDSSGFGGAALNAVVEVIPPNHPPSASDYSVSITESQSVGITLVNLGSDPDGDTLNYAIVEQPQHGSLLQNELGVAYAPFPAFTGTDSFKFKLLDSRGAESAPAQVTISVSPAIPVLTSLTPNSAVAGSGAFTLTVQGSAFLPGAVVNWNGSPRTTAYFNFGPLTAEIPASDLAATPDMAFAQITVRNPGGALSTPLLFTVKNAAVGTSDSAIAPTGGSTTVSTLPTTDGGAGVSATVENTGGSPILVAAAVYSGTPPSGLVIDAGGTYYDLKVSGADASDSITANFYYPSTVTGSAENKPRLTYFNGTTWLPVKSSGNTNPAKNTTDNLDGTASGGRFTVKFDNTSTPKITELAGTVFALANTTPVINSVVGPTNPLPIGTSTTVTVNFQAVGTPDSQLVTFAWDDGTSTTVIPSIHGTASAAHTYASASVNSVLVTVTDANGDQATSTFEYIVVYDPKAGFVTGGGWIHSPAGAYPANAALTGKATFGFVSKYQKGATVPTGNTEFQFTVAGFNFSSAAYQWLVVSGAKAQYKGTGTVNGLGNYGFLLTATDGQITGGGGSDQFRIKIWDVITGGVVYDNVMGAADDLDSATPQALGGGSIVIQKSR